MAVLDFLISFFLNLLLPNGDLLLLFREAAGPVAVLVAIKAQTFSHVIGMYRFIKMVHIHGIIILLLWLELRTIVAVAVGVSEGDGGISAVDIAIDLHDGSDILVEISGDIPHHMNGA
jgi:hypothetical protein